MTGSTSCGCAFTSKIRLGRTSLFCSHLCLGLPLSSTMRDLSPKAIWHPWIVFKDSSKSRACLTNPDKFQFCMEIWSLQFRKCGQWERPKWLPIRKAPLRLEEFRGKWEMSVVPSVRLWQGVWGPEEKYSTPLPFSWSKMAWQEGVWDLRWLRVHRRGPWQLG